MECIGLLPDEDLKPEMVNSPLLGNFRGLGGIHKTKLRPQKNADTNIRSDCNIYQSDTVNEIQTKSVKTLLDCVKGK